MLTPKQKRHQEHARRRGMYYDPATNNEFPLDVWQSGFFQRYRDPFVREGALIYARRKNEPVESWAEVISGLRRCGLSEEQTVRYLQLFDEPHYWNYDLDKSREELLLEMMEKETSQTRGLAALLGFLWLTDTHK